MYFCEIYGIGYGLNPMWERERERLMSADRLEMKAKATFPWNFLFNRDILDCNLWYVKLS